jgi:hypothetical protein
LTAAPAGVAPSATASVKPSGVDAREDRGDRGACWWGSGLFHSITLTRRTLASLWVSSGARGMLVPTTLAALRMLEHKASG